MEPTSPHRQAPELGRPVRPRRLLPTLIPFLMVLLFAGLVAYRELPQFRDFIEGQIRPAALKALTLCREAAVRQSAAPGFARLLDYGYAHETPEGYYVDEVVIGEMQQGRGEVRVEVSCHVSTTGELVQIHRKTLTPVGPLD